MTTTSFLVAAALGLSATVAAAQSAQPYPVPEAGIRPLATEAIPPATVPAPSATILSPDAALPASADPAAAPAPSVAPAAAPAPAPILVETQVDLTGEPGPPADPRAARVEAVNALHWAKTEGCRSDPSPRECVRRAQREHDAVMGRIGAAR